MTGLERLRNLSVELWEIFKPTDPASFWQLVVLATLIVLAFVTRKVQGGFFKAILRIFGTIILLLILNAISPYLMWGMIGFAAIWFICDQIHIPLKAILIGVAIVGAVALAFYNVFLV